MATFIYGTYKVPSEQMKFRVQLAHEHGISHFDTAQLYQNEKAVVEHTNNDDIICTKIFNGNTGAQIVKYANKSIRRFEEKGKKISCMLLHAVKPVECWLALCSLREKSVTQTFDADTKLGISNYDVVSLNTLISYCKDNSIRIPDVHQMEIHPFIDCQPVIDICNANNIRVQAHTVLTQGKMLGYPPLLELAAKYNVSPATILIAWVVAKNNIDICINTSKPQHLKEMLDCKNLILDPSDVENMNGWYKDAPQTYYKIVSIYSPNYISYVIDHLEEMCEILPITGPPFRTLGKQIANELFKDVENEDSRLSRYRSLIKELRMKKQQSQKTKLLAKKGMPKKEKARISGPYSIYLTHPRPMPVDITPTVEFTPFLAHISTSYMLTDIVFSKGACFKDGRMDLCKQVVGPTSVETLCENVLKSDIVKHFLLGNNIAFIEHDDFEPGIMSSFKGGEAFYKLMNDNSKKIETYYLAGNCIGPMVLRIMCDALTTNTSCKALWLKRNNVGSEGCIYLNQMLRLNNVLTVLDLHNCGITDDGLRNLFLGPESIQTVKHLYLDTNCIENLEPLCAWINIVKQMGKSPVSISLSINRLGDTQIGMLATALTGCTSLKRLCLASTHMGNNGLRSVVEMAKTCPKLISLNFGFYKSAGDMGELSGNLYDDDVVPNIVDLVKSCPNLKYLSTIGARVHDVQPIIEAANTYNEGLSMDLGRVAPIHKVENLQVIKHNKRVLHIDSIYRNKM